MLPIPLKLLIHSATLHEVTRDDYGAETDKLIDTLYHVRFEPTDRITRDANGADVQLTAVMFYDAVSSHPVGLSPSVGNSILWDGRRYIVRGIKRLYDDYRLHHLEVELSNG